MEVKVMKRSPVVKEEKRTQSPSGDQERGTTISKKFEAEASRGDEQRSINSSSPERKNSSGIKQDEQLESTRVEMGEVKQENERLKTILARILKDYQSLQMHFFKIVQQDQHKMKPAVEHGETDESELVSLSLGRTSSGGHKSKEDSYKIIPKVVDGKAKEEGEQARSEGLSLSLHCKFDSSSTTTGGRGEADHQHNSSRENSLEEPKEEEAGEPWPPSKMLKTLRSGEDDVTNSQQPHLKKARVSVRARCDAPTMNDGCQWRKYGQKIAKGNPCPRAYYRCTVAPACPVRKQVQRCAEDMSILITTYEGTHNHPLPISATAMASTTSAAACMLMSGPSAPSPPAIEASSAVPTAGGAGLHGLNFGLSDAARQRQLYFPNPSLQSPSYPTITLDLTSPPSSSSPSTVQFSRFSPNFHPATGYGPTNFNFSSLEAASTTAPSWSSGYLSYGAQPYSNKSGQLGFFNLGRQPQDQLYQSYLHKIANATPPVAAPNGQQALTETIAAATKAITADPSFQSVLAAAITSIVGGQGAHGGAAEKTTSASLGGHANQVKWGEQLPAVSAPLAPSATGSGCASSYLTRSTPSNAQPPALSNVMFPQPSLAISSCKSASSSPVRNRD